MNFYRIFVAHVPFCRLLFFRFFVGSFSVDVFAVTVVLLRVGLLWLTIQIGCNHFAQNLKQGAIQVLKEIENNYQHRFARSEYQQRIPLNKTCTYCCERVIAHDVIKYHAPKPRQAEPSLVHTWCSRINIHHIAVYYLEHSNIQQYYQISDSPRFYLYYLEVGNGARTCQQPIFQRVKKNYYIFTVISYSKV